MGFSTAFSKRMPERLRHLLSLLLFLPMLAWAAEIEIANPQILAGDDGYVVSADFRFELTPRLEEAVNKGVALYFVVDFEMTRGRWFWFDEKLVSRSQTHNLSYHALTRQYRLSTGGLHQSFSSLSEALAVLSRLRHWAVIDKDDKLVQAGDSYHSALRMRLDFNQLPKPFQISALGNKDWNLSSDWKHWVATLPALSAGEGK